MIDRKIYPDYPMFYQKNDGLGQFKNEAIKTILQKNPLSDVFFSKENIDYLQNKIINRVYELSGNKHKISRQSDTELKIVMRSIYLQFSLNQMCDIREQIRQLDESVINEVCPGILSGIEQYIKYKEDITTIPVPIQLPQSLTTKGDRSLELPPWF
jgi:hypothetical protein